MYLQNVNRLIDLNGNTCNYLFALLHGTNMTLHIHIIEIFDAIKQYDSEFNSLSPKYIRGKKYDKQTINKYETIYNNTTEDFIFKVDVKARLYRIPRTFATAYFKTNLASLDALIIMREHIKPHCLDIFSIILEYYSRAIIADLSRYTCVNP
jgi:hypothetical protein